MSISISRDALAKIDARATFLGLTRSSYMGLVAQHDVTKGGPLPILTDGPPQPSQPLDLTEEVYDFLLIAIPALQEYETYRKAKEAGQEPANPPSFEAPRGLAETKLWRFFLWERDEILEYKWLQSEKERFDIGLSRAIKEWLQKHRALWIAGLNT